MKNKLTALMLAMLLLVQTFVPGSAWAAKGPSNPKSSQNLVKVGELDTKSYPKLDNKTILAIQKQARENQKIQKREKGAGLFSADNPYLPGQNPTDKEKEAAFGNLKVKFKTFGLKNEAKVEQPFQWNEIFGTDSNGRPGTADIYFIQKDAKTNQELNRFKLSVNSSGDYILKDLYGNPADLPLYSNTLEAYKYDVELDFEMTEKIKLLTVKLSYSGDEQVSHEQRDGKIIYNIPLDLQIAQIASTKFVSEWHTGVSENERPAVNGDFDTLDSQDLRYFPFPKNDTDVLKLRMDSYNLETDDWPGYDPQTPPHLRVIPKVSVEEDMLGDPATYEIDKDKSRITANGKTYKYDFTYDVINGGKLTMTQILPVTFDANGGKFDSITGEGTDQKIVKEVDYSKDLTGEVEVPKKDLESFKGWATEANGKPLSKEEFDKAIKNIKEAKTFYAIWDNNPITAEELIVHESFKADGATEYTNDFIPTLDQLKKQVTIADANGDSKPLADDDKLEILDDSGNPIADGALKDALYEKLKEDDKTEVSRLVTLKAKVTHKNGSSQTVDIPIKVIKNIYEAKTEEGKPNYVPSNYVKVTVDPTTKAEKPQKYFYYLNPEAKVVIPGTDPTGVGNNQFTKWLIKGTETEYKLSEKPRHQFEKETTIEAQYVSDVVPAKDDGNKPEGTPDNFVKVTFVPTDKATDTTQKIFYVNPAKAVTIPVNNPVGKQYYTFKEWTIGGTGYNPSEAKKFETATTITATYNEAKDIIPYNPKEPITRPDGYVRVTFEAEKGLKLTESKAYYVKKGAGITLADSKLVKPAYKEEIGYKFKEWDKEDNTVIDNDDVVVKALATILPDTKEKKDGEKKPEGYVEVKFIAGENGKLKDGETVIEDKTYYVNPTKYVTLIPPTTLAVGNTGYEFGSWSQDAKIPTQYTKPVTEITARFNQIDAVSKEEKPGYVKVEFVIEGEGGSIVAGETSVYYVDPNRKVTLTPPTTLATTGYEFDQWNPDPRQEGQYQAPTKIKGSFKTLQSIIPSDKGKNAKPDGYITVEFVKGDYGELEGETVYYVNPKKVTKLSQVTKPEVKAHVGYQHIGWTMGDDYRFIEGTTYISSMAKYKAYDDVVPKDKPTGGTNEKPDQYITVTFKTTDKGSIDSTVDASKVVYVNPNKAVVLKDKAPAVTGIPGYQFASWDLSIDQAIQYKNGTVITAQYNKSGDISEVPVPGYVKVEFKSGANGDLTGTTDYWIKPGVEVTIPAPAVDPKVGYKFDKWDNPLTVTRQAGAETYTITAIYTEEDPIVPKTKTDDSEKPKGYVTVTFTTDGNGSLEGTTTYFVNPNKEADFSQIAANKTKKPNIGYTDKGGSWNPTDFKKIFTKNAEFKFTFVKLENVIPAKENEERPEGYVTLTLIPTDKATDQTKAKRSFWVKANTDISITSKPTGKEETLNGITYTYTFKGWTVTRGTIASWDTDTIAGKFIQDTEITAQYNTKVDGGIILAAPVPKKNVVTPVGDTPKPEDLIGNPFNPNDPTNPNNLPNGTKITYEKEPDVTNPGNSTAKVKIEYPGGKTTVIDVPLKVVDNVVPQTGNDKPLVPDTYVKVTVATTDKATDNTKFEKIFWVKPGVEVSIPGILDPTGKPETEDGVTKTNNFVKWKLEDSNPEKTYDHGTDIKDTFTAEESKIVAVYEQDKNVEPVGNNGLDVPKGSNPSAKDFIKNVYDDSDPNNKNNLPPGTRFAFDGNDPDTSTPGTNKTTKIKVTYPNGETKTVDVAYNVTEDVVEQTDPNQKPDVPDTFVQVKVDLTDKAELQENQPMVRTFYVNPDKEVTIPVSDPVGKVGDDQGKTVQWQFTRWDSSLTGIFKKETTITALYKAETQVPGSVGYLVTEEGVQPKPDQYKGKITPPTGKNIAKVEIVGRPDVSKPGVSTADLKVTYTDGTSSDVTMTVFVQRKPQTDWQTGTLGPTRTRTVTVVEKEIVKVPAEKAFRKEVRYMQGYNNYFRPGAGLTRAEAAQILANALVEDGYRYDPNFAIHYKDIAGNEWYAKAIRITSQANVFKGYDTGYFDPHKKITRAEWIGTLRRFQELERVSGNHMQVRADHWAMGEIEAAYKEGWLAIYGQGLAKFRADEFIPRQEVAAVSNKAFNRVLDKTYIHRNSKNLINYKDVNPSLWSYEDILCASNGFIHDGKSFWGHKVDYKKDLYNLNLDGYTVTKDKFQRLERR